MLHICTNENKRQLGKNTHILSWAAIAVAALYFWRKAKGGVSTSVAKSVTFDPYINGVPTVSGGDLYIPIAITVKNPSVGATTVSIEKGTMYVGDYSAATLTFSTGVSPIINVGTNSTATFKDMFVTMPLTTVLSVVSENLYEVLNSQFSTVLEKLRFEGTALCGGNVRIAFSKTSFLTDKPDISLGVVATGLRNLKPFSDYSALIPPKSNLEYSDLVVKADGSTEDTIDLMKQVVYSTLDDTKRLAAHLKKGSVKDSVESVWNFVYQHIQYVRDSPTQEQVRRPLRTLYDREGDCDCYATLCASIFENMGIPWKFRITKYYGRSYWQHVYVIVPTSDNQYFTCDPVMDKCFEEKQPSAVKDF